MNCILKTTITFVSYFNCRHKLILYFILYSILCFDLVEMNYFQDFNDNLLVSKGCFVKTQSNSWSTYDNNGRHRHFARWLAFALTEEESEKLKWEPHVNGEAEGSCCDGPDEGEFCVHPLGY